MNIDWVEGVFADDRGEGSSNGYYMHNQLDQGSFGGGMSMDGGASVSSGSSSSAAVPTNGASNASGGTPYTTGARGPKPYVW